MAELAVYDNDPTLYLFTSLTAGSSHIITATSRIETILKANKIPFKGVDTATDELAKKLFQRRARGKKLPLLVKEGFVIADLDQVEEWNEYDELKEALGAPAVPAPAVAVPLAASKPPSSAPAASAAVGAAPATTAGNENTPTQTPQQNLAIRQLGAEAASIAASKKNVPTKISTTNPLLTAKASASSTPTSATTPSKPAVASPTAILSPRSIPLPSTPAIVGKGSGEDVSEFRGRKVQSPGEEEVKMVEKQTMIAEVSSSEEEDSGEEDKEDDEEDDEEEDDEDDEDDEDEEEEKAAEPAKEPAKEGAKADAKDPAKPDTTESVKKEDPPTMQAQPTTAAADKAGVSVED